jgi:hypothetical protein
MSGDLLVVPPTPVAEADDATAARPIVAVADPAQKSVAPALGLTANSGIAAAYDEARLRILRSLERGEIDVAEAGRRLEALDGDGEGDPEASRRIDPTAETVRYTQPEAPDA